MIPTLIIDDEESNRSVLRTLLEKYCPDITIIDEASSADEAFLKINQHKPKLIFLDIKMPVKSGFDLLKMFVEIDFEVIFVTAHDNYAIKAFEFNALGYILKPINTLKLTKTVEKVIQKINSNISGESILHFVKTISDQHNLISKFSLHHHDKVVFINVPDIAFIEAKEDNTILTLFDNTRYYSSKDLIKFETVLDETSDFMRINKSVILNINFIKSYSKGEPYVIEIKNGLNFEVSRRRKSEILKKLRSL